MADDKAKKPKLKFMGLFNFKGQVLTKTKPLYTQVKDTPKAKEAALKNFLDQIHKKFDIPRGELKIEFNFNGSKDNFRITQVEMIPKSTRSKTEAIKEAKRIKNKVPTQETMFGHPDDH